MAPNTLLDETWRTPSAGVSCGSDAASAVVGANPRYDGEVSPVFAQPAKASADPVKATMKAILLLAAPFEDLIIMSAPKASKSGSCRHFQIQSCAS